MRGTLLPAMLLVLGAVTAQAQDPTWSTCGDTVGGKACGPRGLTRREREQAQTVYNSPATRRESGPFELMRDSVVHGSLAVLGGPVRISGTIEGALLVINGDVEFAPTATVTGDVAVLGGRVTGTDSARFGALRVEADSVRYAVDNGTLRLERPYDEIWALIGTGAPKAGIGLRLALTRTYNRVEGLPIEFGPRLRYRTPFGTVAADLFGIFRTGSRLEWNGNNVGHSARVEMRLGRSERWSLGGRLYDVVSPVEDWQLSDVEVGLATFLAHADYRDYYDTHGGSGFVGFRDGRALHGSLELSNEKWRPRRTLNPFTLWRNDEPWRQNPDFDRAAYTRLQLRLSYDTRTDPLRPRSGWWLQGEYELGDGEHETYGTETSAPVQVNGQQVRYGRAMLDLRRYSRLSPGAQLNTRVIAGGWVHGDPLPLQRRMSLSGPGANTGFSFRDRVTTPDALQCSGTVILGGQPALCDRMFLMSVDYRHDIRWLVDIFGGARLIQPDRSGYGGWVLFSDIGRGWLRTSRGPEASVPFDAPKGLNALQTSIGAGLELGQGGVYVAKALGAPPSRGVQVFVRLVRRY
ncbi:MAG TPA: BamA/TamA family outer membrane protein [Gemmatimonadaceae bacterium]|nr:BamA/TamA family outer membrane protein [Gemmatimonadaceae bacterium]